MNQEISLIRKIAGKVGFIGFFVILASAGLLVRIGDVATGIQTFNVAQAEQMPDSKELKTAEKAKEESKEEAKPAEAATEAAAPAADTPAAPAEAPPPQQDWADADAEDLEYSEVKSEMFKELADKRKSMDAREKDLTQREALLKAAESELDRKYQELENVRNEIQGLLKKQTTEEEQRIASLVKIYEGMKAKDAANIFNTLDSDILVEVLGRMSERKSAPIIAEMNPDRARLITILLAEQKKLPTISEDPMEEVLQDEANGDDDMPAPPSSEPAAGAAAGTADSAPATPPAAN